MQYKLTAKGLAVAKRRRTTAHGAREIFTGGTPPFWSAQYPNLILVHMRREPNETWGKADFPEGMRYGLDGVMDTLEKKGLIERVGSNDESSKPRVSFEDTSKPSKMRVGLIPQQPKPEKLSKYVYQDGKGQRLARKHRRGWRRFIP